MATLDNCVCIVQDLIAGDPVLHASIKMTLSQIRDACNRAQHTAMAVLGGMTLSEVQLQPHIISGIICSLPLFKDCLQRKACLSRKVCSCSGKLAGCGKIVCKDCLVDRFPLTLHSTSLQRGMPFTSYAWAIQNSRSTNF